MVKVPVFGAQEFWATPLLLHSIYPQTIETEATHQKHPGQSYTECEGP